jgi:organic hydroperoxide reductase OsmC/OhrA
MRTHTYSIRNEWTGNNGKGTAAYTAYSRNHKLGAPNKAASIECSSDPLFRGDPARYNPEELLLGAISGCHMLWFLHMCADAGIVVNRYIDNATATMDEEGSGAAQFREAILSPVATITDSSRLREADRLHENVHKMCAIARSVNFPVIVRPRTEVVKTL